MVPGRGTILWSEKNSIKMNVLFPSFGGVNRDVVELLDNMSRDVPGVTGEVSDSHEFAESPARQRSGDI